MKDRRDKAMHLETAGRLKGYKNLTRMFHVAPHSSSQPSQITCGSWTLESLSAQNCRPEMQSKCRKEKHKVQSECSKKTMRCSLNAVKNTSAVLASISLWRAHKTARRLDKIHGESPSTARNQSLSDARTKGEAQTTEEAACKQKTDVDERE